MFSRTKVATRLAVGFGFILMILVIVTAASIFKVRTINAALTANSERHAPIQRAAINFRGSAHDRAIATRDLILAGSAAERTQEVEHINALSGFYADSAEQLDVLLAAPDTSPQLKTLYADIRSAEGLAVATTQRLMREAGSATPSSVDLGALLWAQAKPQYVQWLAAINKLIDFEEARIRTEEETARAQASGFVGVMLTALVLAILVSVVAAWAVARSLLRQLGAEPSALANAASQVAHGDLRALPELERAPDGSVAASLAAMRRSLGDVVGQVRDTSSSIASGSSEIAQGNAGLMQRTEAQASSLQQTAASMEEMTGIVQNNAESARQVASLAASASAAAQGGGAVVGQLIVNMNDVSASSHRILDIIGLIDSLAFQTNILALNAAVEAARAGEQGRGFAVVAGEVRNLAQRSATAAKEIKSLIDTSVNKVNEGSRLVDQTGAVMTDIVGQVQRVADLISEISAATLSQTTGITQVSAAVSQLDDATQQNSALAEQSSSAANNLRVEADQLERIVGMFLLESSGALAPASRVAPSEVRRHPRLLHVAVAAHGR